jgi:hypothetical protein
MPILTTVNTIMGTASPGGKFKTRTYYLNNEAGPLSGTHKAATSPWFTGYSWSTTVTGDVSIQYFDNGQVYNTPANLTFTLPGHACLCVEEVSDISNKTPIPTDIDAHLMVNGVDTVIELKVLKDMFNGLRGSANSVTIMDCIIGNGDGLESLVDMINCSGMSPTGSLLSDIFTLIPMLVKDAFTDELDAALKAKGLI